MLTWIYGVVRFSVAILLAVSINACNDTQLERARTEKTSKTIKRMGLDRAEDKSRVCG